MLNHLMLKWSCKFGIIIYTLNISKTKLKKTEQLAPNHPSDSWIVKTRCQLSVLVDFEIMERNISVIIWIWCRVYNMAEGIWEKKKYTSSNSKDLTKLKVFEEYLLNRSIKIFSLCCLSFKDLDNAVNVCQSLSANYIKGLCSHLAELGWSCSLCASSKHAYGNRIVMKYNLFVLFSFLL